MPEVPYMQNAEFQITGFPASGQGGSDVMLLIGKSDIEQDLNEIYQFYNWTDAQNVLGPMSPTNDVFNGCYNAFLEGSKYQTYQSPTISKVYAIAMGQDPTRGDYETAASNSEIKADVDLEVYLQNYDIQNYTAHMVSMAARLESLEDNNMYREALFTLDPTLDVADKVAFTNPTEQTFIQDSRVNIHENEAMQAKYASEVVTTPYYIEPSGTPYRTAKPADINQYKMSDMNSLIEAGIVCDYLTPATNQSVVGTVSPVVSVNTAHCMDATGTRGLDTYTQVRRNVDYQWHQTDLIAEGEVKSNNTELALESLINSITSFFNAQVTLGSIYPQTAIPADNGYYVDAIPDSDNENLIHVLRGIRPTPSIYFIDIQSDIYGPAAQAISAARQAQWGT